MFKSFDLKNEVSSRENTLFEDVRIYSNSFVDDTYIRKYNNATYYHLSNSLTGYLGYYETCYDTTPVTSPTANALCDITYGMSTGSTHYATTVVQKNEKANIYKIFANTLLGSPNSDFTWAGTTYTDLFFITFKRNVFKDYYRDRYVTLWLSASGDPYCTLTASDSCATSLSEVYAGNYGALLSRAKQNSIHSTNGVVGLCFYNAGVIALTTASLYGGDWGGDGGFSGSWTMENLLTGSTIDSVVDGVRNHIQFVNIHPATRIHSTIYKCILLDKDFNLSSNPTYTDTNGLIRVMSGSLAITNKQTRVYITGIGLYDDLDNLLAVAKCSMPILKSPDTSLIFSCRLDF